MKYAFFMISLSMLFPPIVRAEDGEGSRCKAHNTARKNTFKESTPGKWNGTVSGAYYQTPTKIIVKKDELVRIVAKGQVCWYLISLCARPNGTKEAWGLYAKIGAAGEIFKVGLESNTTVEEEGEIIFVIPEGKNLEWEPGDCFFYGDNTGRYKVEVTVTPAAPTPEKTIRHSGSQ